MSDERTYYDPCYHGTDYYHKFPFGVICTDSVVDFCEKYKAFWTIDVVQSYMPILKKYDFLVIFFNVDGEHCSFFAIEDTGQPDIIRQEIEYTDLTVSIKLYLIDGILMFPSDN